MTTEAVARVQSIPYAWPADPTAERTRRDMRGTCAGKHALLAAELGELGIESQPLLVIGPLISGRLLEIPSLGSGRRLLEVHECLTVVTPWSGPLRVDVTWDPPLVHAGLSGTLGWSAGTDMDCAIPPIGPGWAVPPAQLRFAKEALRNRIYAAQDRSLRDSMMHVLSLELARLRLAASGG